jgi:phage terminase large subunit
LRGLIALKIDKLRIELPDIVGKGYGSFWNTRKRYRVLKGGRGSKKSATAALWYIYNIMRYPEANALCVRRTLVTHKDSTFAQLKWAARRLQVFHLWKFTTNPLEAVFVPTGQKILFRGLDDPLKLTSITVDTGVLCWVWIEEAYEIDSEADFDMIDESIRGEMPAGLWKQLTLTYNPWINTHWTKTRFFDNEDPNAFTLTTTFLCNEWLDESDRQKIIDLQYTNPDRYKVVGLGDYGLPGGVYFDEFRSDIHVCKPFPIPKWWKRFRAMDYGFDMLAAASFAVSPEGDLFLYKEIYEPGLHLTAAAQKVIAATESDEKISYTVASPDLWNPAAGYKRHNEIKGPPEVETMIKAGLKGLTKADNRRVQGWRQLREWLTVIERPDEQGKPHKTARLKIFDTCKHAIRTLSSVVKDEHDPEDVADEPHELTHMPEAIRYGIMSRPPLKSETDAERRKRERNRQEALKPVVSDITGW